jgi:alcohol dehydrogenase class IV
MSQLVICGYDAIKQLPAILKEKAYKSIFLVTGKTSYTISGAEKVLSGILAPYEIIRFFDFQENPKLGDLLKGIKSFQENNQDLVIGIGGGTVLDMAKMISIFAPQEFHPLQYINGKRKIQSRGRHSLIAIPTTAGSGSQATDFAVIYVDKKKYSVAHPQILPDVAIVDPQFLKSLPGPTAASSGMDALSQAIESYWSIYSTEESKTKSREAIKLLFNNLREVTQNPSRESLLAVAKGSHLAGEAIRITKTTAPHAISYPLTSHFNIPHGHAVGLTLSAILIYNSQVSEEDTLDKRGAAYVKQTIDELLALLNARDPGEAKVNLDNLMDQIGLTRDFRALGLRAKADIEKVLKLGFDPARVNNNPRKLSAESLRKIMLQLYGQSREK